MEEKGTSKSATDTTTTTSHGKEKTMIITGGNCGLGFDCAKSFLAGDWGDEWHVIIACRDATRAQEAVALLKKETGNNSIEEMPLDLASLASVRNFVRLLSERKDELPPIRAAVFNAGLQVVSGTKYTEDGFETTFGVNHLGHFLLANLLLKLIKAPARLVFVSSGTHDPKKKTGMPDPEFTSARALAFPDKSEDEAGEEKKGSSSSSDKGDVWIGRLRYTTSKLCNVFCAYEMARRLAPDEDDKDKDEPIISVTAFDPGLMPGTGLARDYNGAMRFGWHYILPILRFFAKNVNTPSASGYALARLAADPKLEGVTGKYFEGLNEIPSSEESYDVKKAQDLWEASVELVNLQPEEVDS